MDIEQIIEDLENTIEGGIFFEKDGDIYDEFENLIIEDIYQYQYKDYVDTSYINIAKQKYK